MTTPDHRREIMAINALMKVEDTSKHDELIEGNEQNSFLDNE
jgi:hypothetical protein